MCVCAFIAISALLVNVNVVLLPTKCIACAYNKDKSPDMYGHVQTQIQNKCLKCNEWRGVIIYMPCMSER
jgi:hypothetical protein